MVREPSDRADEIVSVEVRVTGRVHGVGFRYFVHESARRLALFGYVMNLREGGVRAYAEGPRPALETFARAVERGPAGASVRGARTHWGTATGEYTAFSIRPTL